MRVRLVGWCGLVLCSAASSLLVAAPAGAAGSVGGLVWVGVVFGGVFAVGGGTGRRCRGLR